MSNIRKANYNDLSRIAEIVLLYPVLPTALRRLLSVKAAGNYLSAA